MFHEPITPPKDCWPMYRLIASDKNDWWTVHDMQRCLLDHTGETIASKCRKLCKLGLLDWRTVLARRSFKHLSIDYRLAAAGPGRGCEYDYETGQPILSVPLTNQTDAPVEAGRLFDVEPDRERISRPKGRARR
jgi:hypothetical protein